MIDVFPYLVRNLSGRAPVAAAFVGAGMMLGACQSPQTGAADQAASARPQVTAPRTPTAGQPPSHDGRPIIVARSPNAAPPSRLASPPPTNRPTNPPQLTTAPAAPAVAALPNTGLGTGPATQPPQSTVPSFVPLLTAPVRPGPETLTPARVNVPPPATTDTVRAALLLPLSGPTGKLGKSMLDAAQMAVFDFADSRFELLPHDTKGTSSGAQAAAQTAIGDGARVLLGPLLASSVRAVSPAARAAGVPVVGFSSDRSVAGDGVYTLGFLPSAEVRRVVEFAAAKGIARFAALAPDNVYGRTVVAAMERRVAELGGEMARTRFYDPQAQDFTASVRVLADYDERRKALLDQRKELEEKDDEVLKRALKRLENLQTIGDLPFEALLVADGGKRLLSVAALLPFYDVDPGKVQMLGTGQWDVPGLGAEPALVGGWFAAPAPGPRTEFVKRFRETYGRTPPRLVTLAYDATALAAVLARGEDGADFSGVTLTASSGFAGRDGLFRFRPDGTAQRGLAVMQVRRKGAKILSPAPRTFAAIN